MRLRGCLNRGRPSEASWRRLFVGRDGVRAGWRVALFMLTMVAQLLLIAIVLHEVFRAMAPHGVHSGLTPLVVGLNELGLLLPACGASALMAFLEDTSLTAYGLTDPKKLLRLGAGFATGLAARRIISSVPTGRNSPRLSNTWIFTAERRRLGC